MSPAVSFNRTRIAPTPSGFLHAGNVLSFLITEALAKRAAAKLLLRIDDLDRDRIQKKYVEDIFDTLRFSNIQWQEGPTNYNEYKQHFSQLHRMTLYQQALQQLRESGQVFACTCSRLQLQNVDTNVCACRTKKVPLDMPGTCWRLVTNSTQPLLIKTLYGETITTTLPPSMQTFIVRKKDGFPAYQLTSLIDDEYFGVDAIVRGNDLWASTLAQQFLALALNKTSFQNIAFYHHPLLKDESTGNKLSKSAGAASIQYLRGQGKKPADVFTLISNVLGLPQHASNAEELLACMGID